MACTYNRGGYQTQTGKRQNKNSNYLKSKQYHIYNKEKSKTRISPNSTYKIYSALLGLENGIITRNN
ncbi:penicillin-binding transpeptidase domain-containing protein, partial [Clostridioides difficile]|uniref:penicillin-binding transpeptidase domain-containing protein n=1 Tax=Clostridioides difficile TaxID=1496 RepID=UPI003F8D3810